ncbi:MAG: hypothetical protein AB1589_22940 [Cyanobacteriota bacterium]
MLVGLSLGDAEAEIANIMSKIVMTQDNSRTQEQEAAAISNDPTLNKEALNEVVDEYEQSANVDKPTELDPSTQKELGEVERALEDAVLGIEDAS